MSEISALVSDHLEIWTAAVERKSGAGRGGGKRVSLYGIERLRALILDLALRGVLVPQVASDEPASELMKRVRQSMAAIERMEAKEVAILRPTDLPDGWVAVRLADLACPQAGFAFKSVGFNELGVGLPLIRIRDVGQQFTGTFYSGDFREEFVVQEGDYLISMDGEFRVAPWDGPMALLNQRVSRLRFYCDEVVRPFVAMALQAELTQLQGVKAYTTVDHLSGKQIAASVIRLPPFVEQRRIVEKVDELMRLCDALEEESAAAQAAHQALVETLLATLVASAAAAELSDNWTRLATCFDTLFTTEASIDALARTILELAVRGRLVKQDEGDESAAKLLMRITSAEASGGKAGKNRGSTLPALADAEVPFDVPSGWSWARFSQVARVRAELVHSPEFPDSIQIAPDVIEKGTGKLLTIRTVAQAGVRGPNSRFYSGQIIYSKIRPSLSKAVIAPFDGLCSADMYPLDILIDARFMLRLILSEPFLQQVRTAENRIKMPKLNKESLNAFVVPIPPLAEQRRIVAKVEKLLVLCEDLKAKLADAAQTQMHLADAVIERATA